jgi:hypothetical protein
MIAFMVIEQFFWGENYVIQLIMLELPICHDVSSLCAASFFSFLLDFLLKIMGVSRTNNEMHSLIRISTGASTKKESKTTS